MELFEAFDSTMAEILGENEYELLSKQAKVSDPILIDQEGIANYFRLITHDLFLDSSKEFSLSYKWLL